jgi:methyltransferase (TIGR00027 family)
MGRALETYHHRASRLVDDPFAMRFLPPVHRFLVHLLRIPVLGPFLLSKRERQIPGVMGNLLCRTRFIDETLCEAQRAGIKQLVILGAGLDSRAYRLRDDAVQVFEVDHPATQAWKQSRVMRSCPVKQVIFVPFDFETQELTEIMSSSGFQTEVVSIFIWEGVTQYINAEAVDRTFAYLADASTTDSLLVFTYIHKGILDGSVQLPGAKEFLAELESQGEPWVFGIDPAELSGFLAERGFTLLEDVGAHEYRTRFLQPLGRKIDLFEGERVAVARRASREGATN